VSHTGTRDPEDLRDAVPHRDHGIEPRRRARPVRRLCRTPARADRRIAVTPFRIDNTPVEGGHEAHELALSCAPGWLVARFATEHATASWAIVGGGLGTARAVAWLQVCDADLPPGVDPAALLRGRLADRGLAGAIGLLTSRRLDRHVDVTARHGAIAARCIATVGLGNALRAGDPPTACAEPAAGTEPAAGAELVGRIGRIGTINLLCRVSAPLSPEARLEALALATEARALAVREAGVASTRTGLPASGTGTDCVVIAAPAAGRAEAYAGKHTAIGHVVGAAVYDAIRRGVARSLRDRTASAREVAR
jgi:adenosylcobinamide amidohydrolase